MWLLKHNPEKSVKMVRWGSILPQKQMSWAKKKQKNTHTHIHTKKTHTKKHTKTHTKQKKKQKQITTTK